MVTNINGEVSWESDFSGDKKQVNNKDLFLRLSDGSNEVRLLTQPFSYRVHMIKKDENNEKDFGQKVYCSATYNDSGVVEPGTCPACDEGAKVKQRWFLGVIDRKTASYKLLDISSAVFTAIRKLAKNTVRWGDPTKYDIDIVVSKNAPPANYYSVQPIPHNPLSAADQLIRDNVDFEDLKRRVAVPTFDAVVTRLAKVRGEDSSASSKPVKKAAKKQLVADLTDDSDDLFPAHAG